MKDETNKRVHMIAERCENRKEKTRTKIFIWMSILLLVFFTISFGVGLFIGKTYGNEKKKSFESHLLENVDSPCIIWNKHGIWYWNPKEHSFDSVHKSN